MAPKAAGATVAVDEAQKEATKKLHTIAAVLPSSGFISFCWVSIDVYHLVFTLNVSCCDSPSQLALKSAKNGERVWNGKSRAASHEREMLPIGLADGGLGQEQSCARHHDDCLRRASKRELIGTQLSHIPQIESTRSEPHDLFFCGAGGSAGVVLGDWLLAFPPLLCGHHACLPLKEARRT